MYVCMYVCMDLYARMYVSTPSRLPTYLPTYLQEKEAGGDEVDANHHHHHHHPCRLRPENLRLNCRVTDKYPEEGR